MKYQNKNESYFNVPNKTNSYWAGFIAADGYLGEEKNTLSITLNSKDIDHLEILKKEIHPEFELKIQKYNSNFDGKDRDICRFNIVSKNIIQDLKNNWGLHQAKTHTIRFPSHLQIANKKSFLCGYLDGDGSINIIKNKKDKIQLSICGNQEFLNEMSIFLRTDGNINISNNVYKTKGIFTFAVGGKTAIKVLDFLFDETLPLLERKWDKYISNKNRKFGQYIEWTDEEVEILKQSYSSMSCSEIHKTYFNNRSFESVEKKISHINLNKPGRNPQIFWTAQENMMLKEAVSKGLTTAEIHNSMFPYRTYYSVKNQRRKIYQKE